jgi:hypothetical protein
VGRRAARLHPNLAETDLRAALADPETRTEALEILRGLIERVSVKAEGAGLTIELVGKIRAHGGDGGRCQKRQRRLGGGGCFGCVRALGRFGCGHAKPPTVDDIGIGG